MLLAHRGLWWPDSADQNTLSAFRAAAVAGYGVELDVWNAAIPVVSHGRPAGDCPEIDDVLAVLAGVGCPRVAINIKDETIPPQVLVHEVAEAMLLGRAFFFDQSPTYSARLAAVHSEVRVLARASERGEPLEVAVRSPAWGVWLDQFDSDWVVAETIQTVRDAGKTAWVVSPELHHRPLDLARAGEWLALADGVCTDFPHLYEVAFRSGSRSEQESDPCHPADPWWLETA